MFLSKMNTIQATKGGLAVLLMGCLWLPLGCFSEGAGRVTNGYAVEPGDFLRVSVWKEADLQQELLVRPDGGISFPLAGDILAAGRTVTEIRDVLVERIKDYIPEPEVTVQVLQIQGNTVYVMGKVNRPGAFVMTKQLDVTQALALAGGLATFADAGNISILRRSGGSQQAIAFNYKDVEYGRNLDQNILLHPGDVVVVPRAGCPSSNKWDRCLVLLREYFAHHFHVTQRVVDSANDVSR